MCSGNVDTLTPMHRNCFHGAIALMAALHMCMLTCCELLARTVVSS